MDIGINTPDTSFGLKLHRTKEFKSVLKLARTQGKQQAVENAVNILEASPLEGDILLTAGKLKNNTKFKSYSSIWIINPKKDIKADRIASDTNKNPIDLALNQFLEINDKCSSLFKTLFSAK